MARSTAANRGKLRRGPTRLVPLSVFILRPTLILAPFHSRRQLFNPLERCSNPRQAFLIAITPECEHRPTIPHGTCTPRLWDDVFFARRYEIPSLRNEHALGYGIKRKHVGREEFHAQDMNNYGQGEGVINDEQRELS